MRDADDLVHARRRDAEERIYVVPAILGPFGHLCPGMACFALVHVAPLRDAAN